MRNHGLSLYVWKGKQKLHGNIHQMSICRVQKTLLSTKGQRQGGRERDSSDSQDIQYAPDNLQTGWDN